MKIFAIGDLHLPGGDKKPMDIFGPHWKDHYARIRADWQARVTPEDVVLIPGDISWAMHLPEALRDLYSIAELPGTILLLKGNHDYWWNSLTQLRSNLPENMRALQNDAVVVGDVAFCGTRGWTIPPEAGANPQDEKLYRRETARLKLSLDEAVRIAPGKPIVCLMHYPPILPEQMGRGTAFTELMTAYGVRRCVYGHLHGPSLHRGFTGVYRGVQYDLTSCDALDFHLKDVTL